MIVCFVNQFSQQVKEKKNIIGAQILQKPEFSPMKELKRAQTGQPVKNPCFLGKKLY
jgi:hypothetical protein